ncbi:MAG: SGNH/GDSL hydrolase family protein [Bacteroidetes bacterium]|nr:SGNH/GDSL hydrolase family protein [Bacteroidota bacterium]
MTNNNSRRLRLALLPLLPVATAALLSFLPVARKKYVCFGDSITFGAGVPGGSWVSVLDMQHPDGPEFINEGRSGRKTAQRTELLPVLGKHPDADGYIIFLGVNDLKDGNDSLVNDCVLNIKWMIDEIRRRKSSSEIVIVAPSGINLATMSPVNVQKKYNTHTSESLTKLEQRYRQLATQEHTGFISLLHAVSPQNYLDGLHPDSSGQREIAAVIWRGLQQPASN